MQLVSKRKLLENKVHIGHRTRLWNPKAKEFIYVAKKGTHVIDLNVTQADIEAAYGKLKEVTEKGGKVLFVGTKKQAQQIVVDEATRSGSFYINTRWLGGTLTNFKTIQKRIKRLIEIEETEASGAISVYTKKEQALLHKEAVKLNNFLGGIKEMRKLPDAIVVVDPVEDKNAVLEAKKLNIPVIGLTSTNCDPKTVDYKIATNNEGIAPIKLIVSILADAIAESKGGVRQVAFTEEEGDDIDMDSVVVDFEKFVAEQNKKRAEAQAERRAQMMNRNKRFSSEKRTFARREEAPVAEKKAEETPAEVKEGE